MIRSLISLRWQIQDRWGRLRRAFAYATGRLSCGEAQDIILDCRDAAGWYFLMIITPEDVLDRAITLHGDKARALGPHLTAACEYVSRKWEAGDDYYGALDFALDMAREFAAQDGIEIGEDEDSTSLNTEGDHAHA